VLPPVQVASGRWRIYRLPIPAGLAGQQEIDIYMEAPIELPAHRQPVSNDVRPVSLMVNAVWVR
jgi:hypothetical protein